MSELSQVPISAQVIVSGRNKKKIEGNSEITSENVNEYSPDKKTINELNRIFRENGFDVGSNIGISISITAPKHVFEKFLQAGIYSEENGTSVFVLQGRKVGIELKNDSLPDIIKDKVQSITFSLPPEFGPANW